MQADAAVGAGATKHSRLTAVLLREVGKLPARELHHLGFGAGRRVGELPARELRHLGFGAGRRVRLLRAGPAVEALPGLHDLGHAGGRSLVGHGDAERLDAGGEQAESVLGSIQRGTSIRENRRGEAVPEGGGRGAGVLGNEAEALKPSLPLQTGESKRTRKRSRAETETWEANVGEKRCTQNRETSPLEL